MLSSTSQIATTFPACPAWSTSPPPFPPTPIHAMLSFSLGLLLSAYARWFQTQNPAAAVAAAPCMKRRREGSREGWPEGWRDFVDVLSCDVKFASSCQKRGPVTIPPVHSPLQ